MNQALQPHTIPEEVRNIKKAVLRIPTKEQYAYIEVETTGSPEQIKSEYDELTALMNNTIGVSEQSFSEYIINLMNSELTKWGDVDYYQSLSQPQKNIVQSIKRFYKRLQSNQE